MYGAYSWRLALYVNLSVAGVAGVPEVYTKPPPVLLSCSTAQQQHTVFGAFCTISGSLDACIQRHMSGIRM
jgi:hypothetical protein